MKLQFTASAQKDLSRLRAFIAEKNPTAATRISQRCQYQLKTDPPSLKSTN